MSPQSALEEWRRFASRLRFELEEIMSGEITLPEITIEGDPNYVPTTEEDWYTKGFVDGYNESEAAPPMVSETLVFYYSAGYEAGKQSAADRQAEIDRMLEDQPQIEGDLKGESFEKAQEQYNELLEDLFHQHPPHIEVEGEPRVVLPPGIRFVD
jgi:hypothetical protein